MFGVVANQRASNAHLASSGLARGSAARNRYANIYRIQSAGSGKSVSDRPTILISREILFWRTAIDGDRSRTSLQAYASDG